MTTQLSKQLVFEEVRRANRIIKYTTDTRDRLIATMLMQEGISYREFEQEFQKWERETN